MRPALVFSLFLAVGLAAACPAETRCEEGLVLDDAESCVLPAPENCGAGTLAALGESGCLPIGWTDCGEAFAESEEGCVDACTESAAACRAAGEHVCPEGFTAAAPGCAPIIASEPCAGATRPALGEQGCVPLGECDAAFPPADATLFVDASFTDEDLDETHHRTIAGALAATGDVIAIEAGTYPEALVIPRPVKLVGRCAARVTLAGPGNPGIKVRDLRGVAIEGITVRDFDIGLEVERGSQVTLEGVLLEQNQTVGMFVLDADTEVTLRRSAVRDTQPAAGRFGTAIGVGFGGTLLVEDSALSGSHDMGLLVNGSGSRATLLKSAVLATVGRPGGALGWGIAIQEGGEAELVDSLVRQSRNVGVNVVGADARLEIAGSVIDETAVGDDAEGRSIGIGVSAQLGAELLLVDSTVRANAIYGVRVGEPGTTAELRGLVVDGVHADSAGLSIGVQAENGAEVTVLESFLHNPAEVGGPLAMGLLARSGATVKVTDLTVAGAGAAGVLAGGADTRLEATRLLVRDTEPLDPDFGYGVAVSGGATFAADGLGLVRNQSSALFVNGATATLRRATIKDTLASEGGRGRGISAQFGASLDLEATLLENNTQLGLFLFGQGTTASLSTSAIRQTRKDPEGEHGHGLEVVDDAVARLQHTELADNEGVGAIYAQAAGTLELTRVLRNRVGLHVQDGATIREETKAPDEVPALSVVVTASEFSGNETRVGSGAVPLPQPAPNIMADD